MKNSEHHSVLELLKRRIVVADTKDISLQSLEKLRTAFSQSIPYENLSVLGGTSISLQPKDILNKLSQMRGGYCFELNTAFGELLKERGVVSSLHLGRVWLRKPKEIPPRNHATNIVEIEGKSYIADVGFGGRAPRCLVPLFNFGCEIDDGDAQNQPIRALEDPIFGIMIQRRINGEWANQYSLEITPAHPSDIEVANHYQANAPDSHFRHHLFVGRFNDSGRDGLFDNQLTRRRGTKTKVHLIQSYHEMCHILTEIFGINPSGYEWVLQRVLVRSGV